MNDIDAHLSDDACGGNPAPYVLGALTEQEAETFRRHLDSCAVCRDEVATLRAVAATLPAAAPQLAAPRDLKRRVMSEVQADARGRRAPSSQSLRRSRFRAPSWRQALAAVALVAVAIAAGAVALNAGGGNATRVIRAQVRDANASAVLRLRGGRAELTIAHMPQPPSRRVYEVWLVRSGAPQPTDALFTLSASGDASVDVPGSLHDVAEILVTAEPLGGSRIPTRAPVIVAHLS